MSDTSQSKRSRLAELRQEVAALERELSAEPPGNWRPQSFYDAWYATVGFLLGGIAALTSLMFNVIGATIAGKHPLEIIRVYLTFPLGEQALRLSSPEGGVYVIDDGMILALGCCLYLGTGMALGVVFHWMLSRVALQSTVFVRLLVGTVLAALLWFVNFYLILSWLQPALFGGAWITDNDILPWWVALATHLVFGWSMALLLPLGRFIPYQRPTERPAAAH